MHDKNKQVAYYATGLAILVFGVSYASVPLYKMFCQVTGFGGTTQRVDALKAITVKPAESGKVIRINFTSNVHSTMPWTFKPSQSSIKIVPGETALAFYTVKNNHNYAITGVATYNVSNYQLAKSSIYLLIIHLYLPNLLLCSMYIYIGISASSRSVLQQNSMFLF